MNSAQKQVIIHKEHTPRWRDVILAILMKLLKT